MRVSVSALLLVVGLMLVTCLQFCTATPLPAAEAVAAPEPHKRRFRGAYVVPVYVQPAPVFVQPAPVFVQPAVPVYAPVAPVYHQKSLVVSKVSVWKK